MLDRATDFYCCDCNQSFASNRWLKYHLFLHRVVGAKHSCEICGKRFLSNKQLDKHNQKCLAAKEQEKRDKERPIPCASGAKCSKRFKTPSAMIMHLESGGCRSKLNRQKINDLVRKYDTTRSITMPNISAPSTTPIPFHQAQLDLALRMLEVQQGPIGHVEVDILSDSDSDSDPGGVPVYTPSASSIEGTSYAMSPILTPIYTPSSLDIDRSNMHALSLTMMPIPSTEFRCAICLKKFRSQSALEMHVKSPVHETLLYHCPLTFMGLGLPNEERSFKTLSGLVQHLEYGACKGGKETFVQAISIAESIARALGVTGMKLIHT